MVRNRKGAIVPLILICLSLCVLAQTRKRIPKTQPAKSESKASKTAESEQKILQTPFSEFPYPPPAGSPLWCALSWDQAPDLAGIKLGMSKDYVLRIARQTREDSVGFEPVINYYHVLGGLIGGIKNPVPTIEEMEGRPEYKNLPKLRAYDKDTGLEIIDLKMGFASFRQDDDTQYLFHVHSKYFSKITTWDWADIKGMLASQFSIPESNWVRHTGASQKPLQREVADTFGLKQYKQTAYCKGFWLTVEYDSNKKGFTLDLINYPAFAEALKKHTQWEEGRKSRARP